jgi:membrane protease YdiL (CAAX protease family)
VLPLLAPLPLIVTANLAARPVADGAVGSSQSVQLARMLTYLMLGVGLGLLLALGVVQLAVPRGAAQPGLALGTIVASGLALATLWPQARRLASRWLPFDPESPVHMVALSLSLYLVVFLGAQQLSGDVLAEVAAGARLAPADIWLQELPFGAAAILGVGLLTRRRAPEVAARLGWRRPPWWHVALALLAAGLFFAFSQGMELVAQQLTPDLARRSNAASQRLYGGLENPIGIVSIALAPGICEEALFRGALQPRLGLLWTSLVFAAVHTQYGLSLDLVVVLVLGLALGLIRMYLDTTSSTVCHVTYNGLSAALALAPSLLAPVVIGEAVLLVALGAAALLSRRRPSPFS